MQPVAQQPWCPRGGPRDCATTPTTFICGKSLPHRVHKVSVDAGFTCPNVDGTVAVGGCTFCDNRSFSPSRRLPRQSIPEQIDEGIRRLPRRYRTRAIPGLLSAGHEYLCARRSFATPVSRGPRTSAVVGLAIGTRPDCVPDDVLDLLGEIRRPNVSVGRIRLANHPRRSLTG